MSEVTQFLAIEFKHAIKILLCILIAKGPITLKGQCIIYEGIQV